MNAENQVEIDLSHRSAGGGGGESNVPGKTLQVPEAVEMQEKKKAFDEYEDPSYDPYGPGRASDSKIIGENEVRLE